MGLQVKHDSEKQPTTTQFLHNHSTLSKKKKLTLVHNLTRKQCLYSCISPVFTSTSFVFEYIFIKFYSIPKKGNAKQCSSYCTIALISHTSKVMLKILQDTLLQYTNHKLSDVQASFRKGRRTRDQIATSAGSSKRKRVPEEHLFLFH